jgi:two-component system, LytTR family, sensor kinase
MERDTSAGPLDSRGYWRFQLFAWGLLGGYLLTVNLFLWKWKPVLLESAKLSVLMLVSHFIARTAFSRNSFQSRRATLLLRVMLACAIGALLPSLVFYPLGKILPHKAIPFRFIWFLPDYVRNLAILLLWGSCYAAFCFREMGNRMETDRMRLLASSKELQLSTLRNQLNPHFLFNSFNMLRSLVESDPAAARDAITHLAEMMRHSLSTSSHNTISLARELEFVESYVALERLRYEERLRISAEVPEDLRNRRIPSMLLYTLVENAVKYGIDQKVTGVDVSYQIWLESGRLRLRVSNSGKLCQTSKSTGTGLANLRQRLELLYGTEASLELQELDHTVVAQASWPADLKHETPS